jgi:hypothetical protein
MPKKEAPHSPQKGVIAIIASMDFCAPPGRWERHPAVFDAAPSVFWPKGKIFGGITAMGRYGLVWKTVLKV